MKRNGFTLIEVIVVFAIIGLLMAISIPLLRSSRLQAQSVLCASNLKQLQLALSIYESENQTFPFGFDNTPPKNPPPGGYAGKQEFDRTGWWWFTFLEGLYKKSQGKTTVLQCPSKLTNDPVMRMNILWSNYGVNRSICKSSDDLPQKKEFVGKPLGVTSIPHPGQALLIVDSGYSLISWWHTADNPPITLSNKIIEDAAYVPGLKINKKRQLWPGQEDDAIYRPPP